MFRSRLVVLSLLAASACAPKHTRDADTLARTGDWESALTQYRIAAEERPDDFPLQRKVEEAERQVARLWTKRGWQANGEGRLGEAATLWSRAIEILPEEEREKCDAWDAIVKNAAALEYFGDSAAAEERHEDAVGVYGAILKAQPERVDLVNKHMEAKRVFAAQLFERADGLVKKDLPGAALVTDLRALQHDPMQPKAFAAGTQLRKEMRARTRIALGEVKMVDQGYKGLGLGVASRVNSRLADFAPYGPSRDAEVKATLKATIEEFTKNETKQEGHDELPNTVAASTVPISNPAIPLQRAKIAELEQKLAQTKKDIAKNVAERKGKKPAPGVTDPGLALARQADATRLELEDAKKQLAALPAKVLPPPPAPTWQLEWTKTTRVVEARIRFEIQESDYAEPVVVTVAHKVVKEDRSHDGNERQGVSPDALQLPSWEKMVDELARQFSDGAQVIAKARERRVSDLVAKGRGHVQKGNIDAALDAYVTVIFMMGPAALPEDAAQLVAKNLEHDRFKDMLAVQ